MPCIHGSAHILLAALKPLLHAAAYALQQLHAFICCLSCGLLHCQLAEPTLYKFIGAKGYHSHWDHAQNCWRISSIQAQQSARLLRSLAEHSLDACLTL